MIISAERIPALAVPESIVVSTDTQILNWELTFYGVQVDGERKVSDGRRAGRDAPVVGAPGRPEHERNQVRMRYRRVRRLHGACGKQGGARVPDADFDGQC